MKKRITTKEIEEKLKNFDILDEESKELIEAQINFLHIARVNATIVLLIKKGIISEEEFHKETKLMMDKSLEARP